VLAPFRYRGVTPYLVGIAGLGIAALLRHLSDVYLREHLSFSFLYLAVFVAAWTGGWWPATVTTVFGAMLGNYYFSDPHYSFLISSKEEFFDLLFFVIVSLIIGGLSEISLRSLIRAQEAEREKNEFMAALAHEMRSPLSVINYASALSRHSGTEQPNDQLDVIDRQVHHLNSMIEDLLDVSRVARGKITLHRHYVDVADVVDGAVERARPVIDSHRHTLKVQLPGRPVSLHVDPTRIEQVFANLLTNAAKYTPDGGEISVRVQVVDNTVVLSVRDNGIGIAREMLPRVFDLFVQVPGARERSQGGLGIGLALARRIAEMHGGSVEANSQGLDRGSEFVVSLPLAQPAGTRAVLANV
jgi:signal transduction histidine kinase